MAGQKIYSWFNKNKDKISYTWHHGRAMTKCLRSLEDKGFWENIDAGLQVLEIGKNWWNVIKPPSKIPEAPFKDATFLGRDSILEFIDLFLEKMGLEWSENKSEDEQITKAYNFLPGDDWTLYDYDGALYLGGDVMKFRNWMRSNIKSKFGNHISLNCLNWELTVDKTSVNESRLLTKLEHRARSYQKIDEGWSILLHGPPGTGKSTLARGLGMKLGTSLMLRQLDNLAESEEDRVIVLSLLEILEPDVIIMEDMDHCTMNWSELLKFLEEIQTHKKVVIGTVNVLNKFNSAVLRPGRFDQLFEINKLDEETVMELVKGDKDLFEIIKNYPVAYIRELMRRVRALGKEEALTEIDDILHRSKMLLEQDDSETPKAKRRNREVFEDVDEADDEDEDGN